MESIIGKILERRHCVGSDKNRETQEVRRKANLIPKKMSIRPRIQYGVNFSRNPVFLNIDKGRTGCRIKSGMTANGVYEEILFRRY
jgi:hypothetical protein